MEKKNSSWSFNKKKNSKKRVFFFFVILLSICLSKSSVTVFVCFSLRIPNLSSGLPWNWGLQHRKTMQQNLSFLWCIFEWTEISQMFPTLSLFLLCTSSSNEYPSICYWTRFIPAYSSALIPGALWWALWSGHWLTSEETQLSPPGTLEHLLLVSNLHFLVFGHFLD